MDSYLLMMQARLLSLQAQMEAMKADNMKNIINDEIPTWSGDHFTRISSDVDWIASNIMVNL